MARRKPESVSLGRIQTVTASGCGLRTRGGESYGIPAPTNGRITKLYDLIVKGECGSMRLGVAHAPG